jgi:ribonuclease HII
METHQRLVGGVDEAGRGSVLGPLVIAGVSVVAETLKELEELGVKDSKLLSAKKRSSLYGEIVRLSRCVRFISIEPGEIDQYVWYGTRRRKLNFLEAVHMARVIPPLEAAEVFVDAPDTNLGKFTEELTSMIDPCPRIVARHRADRDYVVVSAASIIAKVERDRAVEQLRGNHGDFGSGYPSDPQTIVYLQEWVRREGSQPFFARRSWKTWDRVLAGTLDL